MGPPARRTESKLLQAAVERHSFITAAKRLKGLKEEVQGLSVSDAALLSHRVGGLVNAHRLAASSGHPSGGAPTGAPQGECRKAKTRGTLTDSLDLLESAAAVASALQQRHGGPQLKRALVPFLWVLGEATLQDLPGTGGPSGAPYGTTAALNPEGSRSGEEESEGPPGEVSGAPSVLLQRQHKLRSGVSASILKALEDGDGRSDPKLEGLWKGLVCSAASLLLVNTLSPHGPAGAVAAFAALCRKPQVWGPLQDLLSLLGSPVSVLQQQGPLQQQLRRLLLLLLLAALPRSQLLQQHEGRRALAHLWGRCSGLQLPFLRHLVSLIEDRSVTADELHEMGALFFQAFKVSLEPEGVSLAPQLQQLLRACVFSPLQLAQRCRCCLLPLLCQQTFSVAADSSSSTSSRAAVAALTGAPIEALGALRDKPQGTQPLSVWGLAANFLWRAMKSANWEIRLNAVCLWQLLCSPLPIRVQLETKEMLQQILEDPSPTVRQAGVSFLLQLLRRCCSSSNSNSNKRQEVLLQPGSLTGLLELLLTVAADSGAPSLRCLFLSDIIALLKQNHTSTQPMAAALRQLVPRLLQLTQDSSASVRFAAALLLEAAPGVLPLLQQPEHRQQQQQQQRQQQNILIRCVWDGLVGLLATAQQQRLLQLCDFKKRQAAAAAATAAAGPGGGVSAPVKGLGGPKRGVPRTGEKKAALPLLGAPRYVQQQQEQQQVLLPGVLAAAEAAGPLQVSQRIASELWRQILSTPLQQQVQTLQSLSSEHPSLVYLLAGLLGGPLEGPWVSVSPIGSRGAPSYIDRCKLAAGLFRVVEAELSATGTLWRWKAPALDPLVASQQGSGATEGSLSLRLLSCLYTCGALLAPRGPQDLFLLEKEEQLRRFIQAAFPASLLLERAKGPLCYAMWQLLLYLPGPLFGFAGSKGPPSACGGPQALGGAPSPSDWVCPGASLREEGPLAKIGGPSPYSMVLQQLMLLLEEYLDGRRCCCCPPADPAAAAAAADAAFTTAAETGGSPGALQGPPRGSLRSAKRRRGPTVAVSGSQMAGAAAAAAPVHTTASTAPAEAATPAAAGASMGEPSDQSALFIEVILPFVLQHRPIRQRFLGALWGRLLGVIRGFQVSQTSPKPMEGPYGAREGVSNPDGSLSTRLQDASPKGGSSSGSAKQREAQRHSSSSSSSSSSNDRDSGSSSRRASKTGRGSQRAHCRGSQAFKTPAAATIAAAAAAKDRFRAVLLGPLGAPKEEGWSIAAMQAALEVGALLRCVPGGREALGLGGPPCRLPPDRGPLGSCSEGPNNGNKKRQRQQQQQQQQLLLPQELLLQGSEGYFQGLLGALLAWGPFRRPAAALQQLMTDPREAPLSLLLPLPLSLSLGPYREKMLLLLQPRQHQQELLMKALSAQRILLRQSLSFFLGLSHLTAAYKCSGTSEQGFLSSWGPLMSLVKALGTPRFPRGGGTFLLEEIETHTQAIDGLKAWICSAQCVLEIYGVVFEHVAVLLGTEAPPLPEGINPSTGAPLGASRRPLTDVGPSRLGSVRGPPALRVIASLPKLIEALFGWVELMGASVSGPQENTPSTTAPEGGLQGAPLLGEEALQRLRRLAWRSIEGTLLGAVRFVHSCSLTAYTLPQQQHQLEQQLQHREQQQQQQQRQQQQQQQEGNVAAADTATQTRCCCCCCIVTPNRSQKPSSTSTNCSSSRKKKWALIEATGGPSGCLLARACLGAVGRALVRWGPFVHQEALRDLLLQIHSLFPQKQLLLQFLEACARTATSATVPAAAEERTPKALTGNFSVLAEALGGPVDPSLQQVLQETVDCAGSAVS